MLDIVELFQELHRLFRPMGQDLLRLQLARLPVPATQIRQQGILHMKNIEILISQNWPQVLPETSLLDVIGTLPAPAPGEAGHDPRQELDPPVSSFETGEDDSGQWTVGSRQWGGGKESDFQ